MFFLTIILILLVWFKIIPVRMWFTKIKIKYYGTITRIKIKLIKILEPFLNL